jgi:ribosome-binding factor A
MAWNKFDKLVELVKRRITNVVLYKLKDPRLGFITITKVELTRDLKLCKVFYTVFGPKTDLTKTDCALRDARGFIQREVGKTLRTRTMPAMEFIIDPTMEKMERVQQILDVLKEEGLKTDEDPDEDEKIDGQPDD